MRRSLALVVVGLLTLAGCSSGTADHVARPASTSATKDGSTQVRAVSPVLGTPLRPHERVVDLRMPQPYTPKAPYGNGTDDYRCFLLDPQLASSSFVTGVNVVPGQKAIVHHVILFRVAASQVAAARQKDASDPGEGWTCFGGTGLGSEAGVGSLDHAPWLGAWAPGGGESLTAPGTGIPLSAGSDIVMQVHYNLMAGDTPDQSAAQLRLAPGSTDLKPLKTMLLPAPVELPCRPGHDQGPLCSRSAAIANLVSRFGTEAGYMVSGLQFLCGNLAALRPGPTQHCDRQVRHAATIRALAGHMHLLGRSISVRLNPGTPGARTLLDIPVWNFDNQGSIPLHPPVHVKSGDTLRVTCRHSQRLHDQLPMFDGQPEKYVVWGEGTTDEMCLGIVLMTRD